VRVRHGPFMHELPSLGALAPLSSQADFILKQLGEGYAHHTKGGLDSCIRPSTGFIVPKTDYNRNIRSATDLKQLGGGFAHHTKGDLDSCNHAGGPRSQKEEEHARYLRRRHGRAESPLDGLVHGAATDDFSTPKTDYNGNCAPATDDDYNRNSRPTTGYSTPKTDYNRNSRPTTGYSTPKTDYNGNSRLATDDFNVRNAIVKMQPVATTSIMSTRKGTPQTTRSVRFEDHLAPADDSSILAWLQDNDDLEAGEWADKMRLERARTTPLPWETKSTLATTKLLQTSSTPTKLHQTSSTRVEQIHTPPRRLPIRIPPMGHQRIDALASSPALYGSNVHDINMWDPIRKQPHTSNRERLDLLSSSYQASNSTDKRRAAVVRIPQSPLTAPYDSNVHTINRWDPIRTQSHTSNRERVDRISIAYKARAAAGQTPPLTNAGDTTAPHHYRTGTPSHADADTPPPYRYRTPTPDPVDATGGFQGTYTADVHRPAKGAYTAKTRCGYARVTIPEGVQPIPLEAGVKGSPTTPVQVHQHPTPSFELPELSDSKAIALFLSPQPLARADHTLLLAPTAVALLSSPQSQARADHTLAPTAVALLSSLQLQARTLEPIERTAVRESKSRNLVTTPLQARTLEPIERTAVRESKSRNLVTTPLQARTLEPIERTAVRDEKSWNWVTTPPQHLAWPTESGAVERVGSVGNSRLSEDRDATPRVTTATLTFHTPSLQSYVHRGADSARPGSPRSPATFSYKHRNADRARIRIPT
jgi:hypothetical protein